MDLNNMPDFSKMMESMQKMQSEVLKAQNDLASQSVTGQAGNGAVKVSCSGTFEFTNVKISKEFFESTDIETLEDTVLIAIKDACKQVLDIGQKAMSSQLGMLNGMPPFGT